MNILKSEGILQYFKQVSYDSWIQDNDITVYFITVNQVSAKTREATHFQVYLNQVKSLKDILRAKQTQHLK